MLDARRLPGRHRGWTSRCCARSPPAPTARTSRRPTTQALASVYDSIALAWTVADEHIELTALFAAVGAAAAARGRRAVVPVVRAGGVAMGVQWPLALLSLLVVPLLVAAYVWQNRRRRRQAVRHSSVALIRAAAPKRAGVEAARAVRAGARRARRCSAWPRPARRSAMDVPISDSTIILALDVSGSMCSTDVEPNRLTAAETAVREFVQNQDADTRIGLVVFSGFAQLTVAPTTEREALLRSLDGLTTGRGTAIGAAMLKSVDAIAEIDPEVAPSDPGTGADAAAAPRARPPGTLRARDRRAAHRRRQHHRRRARRRRQDRGGARGARLPDRVRHPQPGGDGLHGGPARRPRLRELRRRQPAGVAAVATAGPAPAATSSPTRARCARWRTVTGGQYFAAADAGRLQDVLRTSRARSPRQQRDVEVSVAPVALAAALLLGALWAAARWSVGS